MSTDTADLGKKYTNCPQVIVLGSKFYIFIFVGKGIFSKTTEPSHIHSNKTKVGSFFHIHIS